MRDDLEHGWLTFREHEAEEIGYCEWCEKTIYGDEEYKKVDGEYFCEECYRRKQEEKECEE